MSMHHSDNRYRGVTSTSSPMSVGQRIAMAIAIVFALGAVVLFFIAPGLVFALGGGAVLIGLAGRSYAENRGAARVILPLVWLIAPVAGLVLLFGNGGFLFFGLIEALLAPFGGAAAAWQALALLPRIVDLPMLAEPLLLGAASGLVAGCLTHWRRWRIGERTTDSLVSSALSGDRWSLTVLSLQTFAVSVAAAYVAASLLAMLGVFDIANADPLAMASALSHSVGGGGGPPYGPHALSLILVLLIALAAIGGFGTRCRSVYGRTARRTDRPCDVAQSRAWRVGADRARAFLCRPPNTPGGRRMDRARGAARRERGRARCNPRRSGAGHAASRPLDLTATRGRAQRPGRRAGSHPHRA